MNKYISEIDISNDFSYLPHDVIFEILTCLPIKDVLSVACVSHRCSMQAQREDVTRALFCSNWGLNQENSPSHLSSWTYYSQDVSTDPHPSLSLGSERGRKDLNTDVPAKLKLIAANTLSQTCVTGTSSTSISHRQSYVPHSSSSPSPTSSIPLHPLSTTGTSTSWLGEYKSQAKMARKSTIQILKHQDEVLFLTFSNHGLYLLTASRDGMYHTL